MVIAAMHFKAYDTDRSRYRGTRLMLIAQDRIINVRKKWSFLEGSCYKEIFCQLGRQLYGLNLATAPVTVGF